MPFDAAGFSPAPGGPGGPGDRKPGGGWVTVLIVVVSVALLATPISLAACADLVRFVWGR